MLDGRGRNAQFSGGAPDTAQSVDHLESSRHSSACTTIALLGQEVCATFAVAPVPVEWHAEQMLSQEDILSQLSARGITQGDIGAALGINRTNANKLFNPVAKTGKTRSLTWDEGVALIETFGLDRSEETAEPGELDASDDTPPALMGVQAARLVVQYVAQQLGVKIDPDDGRVEDLAQDIRAYSEFVASAQVGENPDRAQGWLDGRRSHSRERA